MRLVFISSVIATTVLRMTSAVKASTPVLFAVWVTLVPTFACTTKCSVIPPKVDLGPRLPAAADGSLPQWPRLPTPFAAYSNGPGLTELLRLYVCGLQPRPSVQLHFCENGNPDLFYDWTPASAGETTS